MFCQKCGKEIQDGVPFCPWCGAHTNAAQASGAASSFNYYTNQVKTEARRYNVWAIVGFAVTAVSFFLPGFFTLITGISALVMSIYATKQIKVTGEKGNVFAILGIVFGSAFVLYGTFCVFVIIGALGVYGNLLSNYLSLFLNLSICAAGALAKTGCAFFLQKCDFTRILH